MPNPYASKSSAPYKAENVNMTETSSGVTRGLEDVETVNEVTPHLNHHTDVPEGNIEGVLRWVGDDEKKAALALRSEESSEKPRKTLIEKLKDLLDG